MCVCIIDEAIQAGTPTLCCFIGVQIKALSIPASKPESSTEVSISIEAADWRGGVGESGGGSVMDGCLWREKMSFGPPGGESVCVCVCF